MADGARAIVKKAEQKMKGSGGIMAFLGGGPNYAEANDMYVQAANQFKLAKDIGYTQRCALGGTHLCS